MESDYSYQVTDITSKNVFQSSIITARNQQLDLSGVAAGMYFLSINSNGTTANQKLLVR